MIFRYLPSFAIVMALISCEKTDHKLNFTNSSLVAFNLIKTCVDKTLNVDRAIHTKNYVLDLNGISTLNKVGVDSFLNIKYSTLPVTSDDSTMIFDDKKWETFHMKQSMIIRFDSIKSISDSRVHVTMHKLKSSAEILAAEIDLERHLDGYRITKFLKTR